MAWASWVPAVNKVGRCGCAPVSRWVELSRVAPVCVCDLHVFASVQHTHIDLCGPMVSGDCGWVTLLLHACDGICDMPLPWSVLHLHACQ